MPSYAASNPTVGANNRSKRAEIPFTIVGNATIGSITASIDDPFNGSAEIFVGITTGASVAGANGGTGGSSTSTIDPSASFASGISSDGAQVKIGFVVLDGATELQQAGVPLPGNAQNPTYGTPAAKGSAVNLRHAEVVFSDGAATNVQPGTVGAAARAALGAAGVTTNGNLKVVVGLPLFMAASATPTAIVPTLKAAGTMKGVLKLVWD